MPMIEFAGEDLDGQVLESLSAKLLNSSPVAPCLIAATSVLYLREREKTGGPYSRKAYGEALDTCLAQLNLTRADLASD